MLDTDAEKAVETDFISLDRALPSAKITRSARLKCPPRGGQELEKRGSTPFMDMMSLT